MCVFVFCLFVCLFICLCLCVFKTYTLLFLSSFWSLLLLLNWAMVISIIVFTVIVRLLTNILYCA